MEYETGIKLDVIESKLDALIENMKEIEMENALLFKILEKVYPDKYKQSLDEIKAIYEEQRKK
jgi:hypothetical protein